MAQGLTEEMRDAASEVEVGDKEIAEVRSAKLRSRTFGFLIYTISFIAGFGAGQLLAAIRWQEMIAHYPYTVAPALAFSVAASSRRKKIAIRAVIAIACFTLGMLFMLPAFTIGIGYGVFGRGNSH